MVGNKIFTGLALAGSVLGLPTLDKRANLDVTVLQFALTLEHLENNFYRNALANFSAEDFAQAGFDADYYNNLQYIAYDEQQHTLLLQAAIKESGATPVTACQYSFPYTDPLTFVTLSSVIEGVGTAAYLGAAPLITKKEYLTVAGSILAIEALHTSMQRGAINEVPMADYLYTSLDGDSVYSLATMFITSCPSTNFKLPFSAFPTLQLNGKSCTDEEPQSTGNSKRWGPYGPGWPTGWQPNQNTCSPPSQGATVQFTAENNVAAGSFVTWISGLTVTSVAATISGKTVSARIPAGITGQSYAFVTKTNSQGTFADAQVLYGPAVVEVNPPPQ